MPTTDTNAAWVIQEDWASPEELLEFCNRVREVGGADTLEALLPGIPQEEYDCLIAVNLNFACKVSPVSEGWAELAARLGLPAPKVGERVPNETINANRAHHLTYGDGEKQWFMIIPQNEDTPRRLSEQLELPLRTFQFWTYNWVKPEPGEAEGSYAWNEPIEEQALLLPRRIGRAAEAFDNDWDSRLSALATHREHDPEEDY